MIVVSACLAGFNCRYNGSNKENPQIVKLIKEGQAIPVCPEHLGGLPTPRKAAEILNNKVVSADGEDFTEAFIKGAKEVLNICQKYNCTKAIFKFGSPSCGCNLMYDGTFTGNLIEGDGITTKLLKEHGIEVISEKEIVE